MTDKSSKKKTLEERISELEKAVFGSKKTSAKSSKKSKKFSGLVGGIELLMENNFFKKPVLVTEVQEELRKEGYFHSVQATDTILRRDMVKRKKILTRIKIDGIWQYVIRR